MVIRVARYPAVRRWRLAIRLDLRRLDRWMYFGLSTRTHWVRRRPYGLRSQVCARKCLPGAGRQHRHPPYELRVAHCVDSYRKVWRCPCGLLTVSYEESGSSWVCFGSLGCVLCRRDLAQTYVWQCPNGLLTGLYDDSSSVTFPPVFTLCCVLYNMFAQSVFLFFYSPYCVECLIEEIILSEEGALWL